jgi:uncharacterized protein (DUF433 family)
MRIPVSVIVSQLAHGASVEAILESYPDLEKEDVQQVSVEEGRHRVRILPIGGSREPNV